MVAAADKLPSSGLKMESLAHIDISTLSHSELHALSLCSDSAFDLRRTDDLVTPKIDPTVFNESAGSRRQVYSRLRHSPRSPDSSVAGHRHRHNSRPAPASTPDDPEIAENNSIVRSLKHLLAGNGVETSSPANQLQPQHLQLVTYDHAIPDTRNGSGVHEMQIVLHSGERKRKRGRKPKPKALENGGGGVELEIVNRDGDVAALDNADDQFSAELKRRTIGMETEEEFLGFLRNLEGQWGSRRKRRRIVNANEIGDALPEGWKLVLALKRREGRVSVYCRRYISPIGQQFVSFKEASLYLQSHVGASEPNNQSGGNNQQAIVLASRPHAGPTHNDCDERQDTTSNSILTSSLISGKHDKEVSLVGIENLTEVHVQELFECYKCNVSFDEKDAYLQHLMLFHKQTTRRFNFGLSVGERSSYNGHVGTHVRKHVKSSEKLPVQVAGQDCMEPELPSRISKMDALIEIAQSSILETSNSVYNDKPEVDASSDKMNLVTVDAGPNSHLNEMEMAASKVDEALGKELNQLESVSHMTVQTHTSEHLKPDGEITYGNSMLESDPENKDDKLNHGVIRESHGQAVEDVPKIGVAESSATLVNTLNCFTASPAMSNKGDTELCTVGQRLENVAGFEDLRLEEIEPLKFNFVHEQELWTPHELPMDLANECGMEQGFKISDRFESETVEFNMMGKRHHLTSCVWCRIEFHHESVDSVAHSDTIGFMCPTCKAKISGQLNVLDNSLSMNLRHF